MKATGVYKAKRHQEAEDREDAEGREEAEGVEEVLVLDNMSCYGKAFYQYQQQQQD